MIVIDYIVDHFDIAVYETCCIVALCTWLGYIAYHWIKAPKKHE